MKVTYETKIVCSCPVDETVLDVYDLSVESDETIEVENLLEFVRRATLHPAFQEDVTRSLAAMMPRAMVTTTGVHSGVRVVCVVSPEDEA